MQQYLALSSGSAQDLPKKSTLEEESGDEIASLKEPDNCITDWPLKPRTLEEATPSWIFRLLPHVLLILIPLASIGLVIAVLHFNGKAESKGGNSTKQAMAVTATLWPILFAAVFGPTLKAITLYRAEHGAKLGVLETFFSSQTLVSTLRGCCMLRVFSVWPVLLVLVWSLSPAGGQGALRALEFKPNTTDMTIELMSYPKNDFSAFKHGLFIDSSTQNKYMNEYRALAGAVFTTQDIGLLQANGSSTRFEEALQRAGGEDEAIRITKRDIWRNARIPFIHLLPGDVESKFDWIPVPSDAITEYSSLIGVPIRGFPSMEIATTEFVIQTNYQRLKCEPWVYLTPWIQANNHSLIMHNYGEPDHFSSAISNIWFDVITDNRRIGERGFWADPKVQVNDKAKPFKKMTLVALSSHETFTRCEVATEYVDSLVNCTRATKNSDLSCSIRRMRRTPGLSSKNNLTALDFGRTYNVLKQMPYINTNMDPSQRSILERWLRDPPTALQRLPYVGPTRYDNILIDIFSNRLAVVLNTNIQATLNMTIIVGSDGVFNDQRDSSWANTTCIWKETRESLYSINKIWFSLYVVSAIVLLICALANVILRSSIHAPDFLGSISSLTRDSLFLELPTPASGMDGTERSRLLQDKWVMIQDVKPDDAVGRIALSDAAGMVRLQKSRMYI